MKKYEKQYFLVWVHIDKKESTVDQSKIEKKTTCSQYLIRLTCMNGKNGSIIYYEGTALML